MMYPIAETFDSLQGEGQWAGTPMSFIRFAGCSVGYYRRPSDLFSTCQGVVGSEFQCDTNYHRKYSVQVSDLLEHVHLPHLCLTGGEPFMHDLEPIVMEALRRRVSVHIETSGSRVIPVSIGERTWITCSPKKGFLWQNSKVVSEWKFILAVQDFENEETVQDLLTFSQGIEKEMLSVQKAPLFFIQPVGCANTLHAEALRVATNFVLAHPQFRLSLQQHKVLGLR